MRRFAPIVTFLAGCVFTLALLARCSVAPANAGDAVAKTQVFSVACDQVAKDESSNEFSYAKVSPAGFDPSVSIVTAMTCDCVNEKGTNCFARAIPWQPEQARCAPVSFNDIRVASDDIHVFCGRSKRAVVSVVSVQ